MIIGVYIRTHTKPDIAKILERLGFDPAPLLPLIREDGTTAYMFPPNICPWMETIGTGGPRGDDGHTLWFAPGEEVVQKERCRVVGCDAYGQQYYQTEKYWEKSGRKLLYCELEGVIYFSLL
ncbi:MAG: hypothetical protein ACRC31_04900 [Cetobacterium sp.]